VDYTLMRSAIVVVFDVLAQNLSEMIFTKNEKVIQTFSTNGADASFDEGVSLGCAEWCLQQLNSKICFENLFEAVAIFAVTISQQETW